MVDRFFSGVRQLNRVFSLRHLTIECGKEHRTFDCKNKLLDWDHFFTLTFSRRHWNDKFHIARWIIVENRSGSINKSWRFRLPDFYNRHLFGLLPVSLRVLSHSMWQQFEATVQRQLFFLSDQRERENCKVMFNERCSWYPSTSNRPKQLAICILKICFVNFFFSYNSTVSDPSGQFNTVFNNLSFLSVHRSYNFKRQAIFLHGFLFFSGMVVYEYLQP